MEMKFLKYSWKKLLSEKDRAWEIAPVILLFDTLIIYLPHVHEINNIWK